MRRDLFFAFVAGLLGGMLSQAVFPVRNVQASVGTSADRMADSLEKIVLILERKQ